MTDQTFQLAPMMRRVERAAWDVIRKCFEAKRLSVFPLPVPVEQWIEGPLGIRLTIANLAHLGSDVLGQAIAKPPEIKISQTLVDRESRFRFTAAHELGHLCLHTKLAADFRDSTDGNFLEQKIEHEADRFAAAFLMPIPALCVEYPRLTCKAGWEPLALLESVAANNGGATAVFRDLIAPHLSRRFGVAQSTAVRRFGDVLLPNGARALPVETVTKFVAGGFERKTLWST